MRGLVVVEAKSTVGSGALEQLSKACSIAAEYFQSPVQGFIGGPCFSAQVKKEALDRKFSIVELSGERYRIIDDCKDNKIYA